jgi:hypothetical protein
MYSESRTLINKNINETFLDEDRDEIDCLLSNLSTSQSSADEESQKEILSILNRRSRTQSSNTLRAYSNIIAPVPFKKSSSFVIERITRPCNL